MSEWTIVGDEDKQMDEVEFGLQGGFYVHQGSFFTLCVSAGCNYNQTWLAQQCLVYQVEVTRISRTTSVSF